MFGRLHPDTLHYFVIASGFQNVQVEYRSPWPLSTKLSSSPEPSTQAATSDTAASLLEVVLAFNENVEKLNRLLFADQDYAVIGERP